MGSAVQLSGRVALFVGLVTLVITGGWGWFTLHYGTPLDPQFMSLLESRERLIGFVGLALVFQYGLPFLCAVVFFFGVPARREWAGRIGMAAAGISLIVYARFLWVLVQLLTGP